MGKSLRINLNRLLELLLIADLRSFGGLFGCQGWDVSVASGM